MPFSLNVFLILFYFISIFSRSGRCFRPLYIRFLLWQQLLDGFISPLRCHLRWLEHHRQQQQQQQHRQQGQQLSEQWECQCQCQRERDREWEWESEQWTALCRGICRGLQQRLQCAASVSARFLCAQAAAKWDHANTGGKSSIMPVTRKQLKC